LHLLIILSRKRALATQTILSTGGVEGGGPYRDFCPPPLSARVVVAVVVVVVVVVSKFRDHTDLPIVAVRSTPGTVSWRTETALALALGKRLVRGAM
jgi:hypothetical protein